MLRLSWYACLAVQGPDEWDGFEQGAKEAGEMRLEGKDYVVRDGDVMHFRFNV